MTSISNTSKAIFIATLLCSIGSGVAYATTDTADKASKTLDAAVLQPGGYSNINNSLLQQMLDEGVTVIDIRREEEWRDTGIIEGVTPITFFTRNGQINPKFVPEFMAAVQPNQKVALICRSGNRTQAASKAIAQQLGYKEVFNVTHGMVGWLAEKRPVIGYPN